MFTVVMVLEHNLKLMYLRTMSFVGQCKRKFSRYISFHFLQELLLWSQVKQKSLKSANQNTGNIHFLLPSDLTSIVHLVIRMYDIHILG